MHHRVNPAKGGTHFSRVGDVPDDQLETLREGCVSGGEIVVNYNFMVATPESVCHMASDVSCASNYQNPQASSIPISLGF